MHSQGLPHAMHDNTMLGIAEDLCKHKRLAEYSSLSMQQMPGRLHWRALDIAVPLFVDIFVEFD